MKHRKCESQIRGRVVKNRIGLLKLLFVCVLVGILVGLATFKLMIMH